MRTIDQSVRGWIPVAAGLLLILLATSPPTFGESGDPPMAVAGHQVSGNVVQVTVTNPSSDPQTATVQIQVVVDGEVVHGFIPVTVMGGGTASVPVGFTSSVEEVQTLGITQGGNPF